VGEKGGVLARRTRTTEEKASLSNKGGRRKGQFVGFFAAKGIGKSFHRKNND